MFVRNVFLAAALLTLSLAGPAGADEAHVVAVRVVPNGDGSYEFDVTLRHPDTGWDHYVDRWDVIGPDGKLLGKRVLYHPHVNEQPFTRSQRVRIPAGVTKVSIRTHCKRDGDGKTLFKIDLPK
jgi:hypothetical protein